MCGDARVEAAHLRLDRLLTRAQGRLIEARQRRRLGQPPLELAEPGEERAALGRPPFGGDLAAQLAQVEQDPLVLVVDDAAADLAPADLELVRPPEPRPAHAQGGDLLRWESVLLGDRIDRPERAVLRVAGRAMQIEGDGDEVALLARALVALAAAALDPDTLGLRDLGEVAGELGRLRRVVAELQARSLGRPRAQDGELGMAREAAEMALRALHLVDGGEPRVSAPMLDVAAGAGEGRSRRGLAGVAAAEEHVDAVGQAPGPAGVVATLAPEVRDPPASRVALLAPRLDRRVAADDVPRRQGTPHTRGLQEQEQSEQPPAQDDRREHERPLPARPQVMRRAPRRPPRDLAGHLSTRPRRRHGRRAAPSAAPPSARGRRASAAGSPAGCSGRRARSSPCRCS